MGFSALPRPSSLPHLDWCPRYVSRPEKTADEDKDSMDLMADEGTYLHAKMEETTVLPATEWSSHFKNTCVNPAQETLLESAADQVRDVFSMGLPVFTKENITAADPGSAGADGRYRLPTGDGVYLECTVDPEVVAPGTADIVAVMGANAVLIDYKFTMVERDHAAQMMAYVLGVFNSNPHIQIIEVRIVAPRLRNVHLPQTYEREKDLKRIRDALTGILARTEDPFTPGVPGAPCATCAGNGRCPWQMASLREIPMEAGIILADAWKPVLEARDVNARAERRRLCSWLGKMLDAIKADDKAWDLENRDTELPGFARTYRAGRLMLDKTRSSEICQRVCDEFGFTLDQLTALVDINQTRVLEYAAVKLGLTEASVKKRLRDALAPYSTRSPDIVYFRELKRSPNKLTK